VAATVVYVEHGLRAALNNKSGLLLTRGFPGTPKLQLTSHPDFGLRVVGLGTEIVVSLATDGSSKLHLRIETQTGEQRLIASWDVETNDSETQDTILDSLCLSYLDIMGEGFAAPEKGTSLRVLFTPRLKPLKFEPASEKSENPKGGQKKAKKTKDDLPAPPDDPAIDDTLAALNMLAKLQPAEGRLRVDGITLAGQDLDLRLTPALEGDFEKLGKGHFANDIFRGKRHGIGFELATDSRGLIFARVEVRDYPKENEGESGERERCRSFADLLRKFGEVHGSVLIKYPNGPELPIICFANQTDP
jgi:hypothetical protein